MKCAGARSTGNPHAACDEAGAGNGITVNPTRARRGKLRIQTRVRLAGYRASPRPYRVLAGFVAASPQIGEDLRGSGSQRHLRSRPSLALQPEDEDPDLRLEREVFAENALDLRLHTASGEPADAIHNHDQQMEDKD
jgi:hypothetical protein